MTNRRRCVNLALEAEFDLNNASRLSKLLEPARGADEVIIDCSQLEFIDSTALTQLFRLYQSVEDMGGRVILAGVRPHIRKVFALTRLDAVFRFAE